MTLVINLILHWINYDNDMKIENKMLKQEKEIHKNNVEQIKKLYDEIKILRHNLKHYAEITVNLINSEEYDALKKYVCEVSENHILDNLDKICTTGNIVVDEIINYKMMYARKKGIIVKTDINYRIKNILDVTISIILANLIDNAIEACLLQEDNKLMKITINKKKEYVMIEVSNKIDKSVLENNGELKSTKKETGKHGLGIKSVKNVVEKCNGLYDFYEDSGFFIAEVFLHEYQI